MKMILDTSSIQQGSSTLRQLTGLESVKERMPPLSEKIDCVADVDRSGPTIVVHLRFQGHVDQECARCLSTYQHPVEGDLRLILQECDGRHGPAEEGDTADFYFNTKDFLVDISPLIFDEIMVSLPLKPLCDNECRGIDPGAGAEVGSDMEQDSFDPRWEALRKIQRK